MTVEWLLEQAGVWLGVGIVVALACEVVFSVVHESVRLIVGSI